MGSEGGKEGEMIGFQPLCKYFYTFREDLAFQKKYRYLKIIQCNKKRNSFEQSYLNFLI